MSFEISKNGTVKFVFKTEVPAKKVCVAGSFNDWEPIQMRKQKNGQYACTVELPRGLYEYKFLVDGVWQHDPENETSTRNTLGTLNSVAVVK